MSIYNSDHSLMCGCDDPEKCSLMRRIRELETHLESASRLYATSGEERDELRAQLKQVQAEERYWRHEVVTTRLCPVDHKQPHVSHDCIEKIEQRWKQAEAEVERLRAKLHHYEAGEAAEAERADRLERRVRDADARKAIVMRAAEMLLGNVAFQVFQDRGFRACADQLRAVLVSESPEKKP